MQFLRERGLYDQATILLLSDHGEGLGDHGEDEHGLFLYDETLRVPLMIKMPAARSRGLRIARPVQHIDVVPTILESIGAPVPSHLRGHSLWPLLNGQRQRSEREEAIYSESFYGRYHFGWSELTALTESRYRFIHAPRDELYDLLSDPQERHNLIDDRRQTAVALNAALTRLIAPSSSAAPASVTDEQRERLDALGYVTTQADIAPTKAGSALPDPKDKVGVLRAYRRVLTLVQDHQLTAAIDVLRSVLATEPEMADLWFQLATLFRQTGQPKAAIDAYRAMLRQNPHAVSGALGLGATLLSVGRFDDARRAVQDGLSASHTAEARDLAAAHELLARVALASGDNDTARTEAAIATKADPSLAMPQFINGRIEYSRGHYDQAWLEFQEALHLSSQRTRQVAELHLYSGDTLAHLGHFAEAEMEFKNEVRYFPQNVSAYASLANLYHAEDRSQESLTVLEMMVRNVSTREAYGLAAQLLTNFGDTNKAAAVRAASNRLFARPQ
jgi:tetratricopeptide (TPR) repeat protein